ncbi:interleukin-1 receptor-associated kinase 4 [Vigna unguiculata]|uniref:Interleukin-1 receptor-associated kinase 4 n=1 Tax=Vigna unguiculata TaxID=3917 RepID=A0A4D6NH99_VIGUN|nr:interleukin-1 receptor-associated kinase 4 [Vigna unguiculata]
MFAKCFGESSSSGREYPTVIEELCRHFSLADIRKSTNNFDDNRVIGHGTCCKVFKGCLRHNDGSYYPVAVKRFHWEYSEGFKREVELLCQLHHPNCVSIVGFCKHKTESIVVYEYMSNGSLEQHLGSEVREALPWKKRLEICVGAARGLHYLHSGLKRTIIHHDIRPSKILLDDNMHPKLSGFSLSLLGAHFKEKPKPIKTDFAGTYGYVPMEYLRDGTVTDKCDVYAFGVVLLEVVIGSLFFLIQTELLGKCVEENIDPKIKGEIAAECWQVFIDIALRCIKNEADERPAMGEVEVELEQLLGKCVEENIDPKIKGEIAAECWQVFIDIALRCIKNEADERPAMGEVEVELEQLLGKCVEENIDPKIKGEIAAECWQVFIDIALRCIKNEADERPAMGEVEVELERALLLQQQADLTNIDMNYTLLSKTIIIPKSEGQINYFIGQKQEQESNTVT